MHGYLNRSQENHHVEQLKVKIFPLDLMLPPCNHPFQELVHDLKEKVVPDCKLGFILDDTIFFDTRC